MERKRGTTDKNRKPQTHKKRPKKRVAIPVSTPKIPVRFEPNSGQPSQMGAAALMYQKLKNEINSNLEKGMFEVVIELEGVALVDVEWTDVVVGSLDSSMFMHFCTFSRILKLIFISKPEN